MTEDFCEAWFEEVRARVEPTPLQRDQALGSQRRLRELLSEGRFGRRIVDDYMSGSFSRHTAIRPVDDVDLVFVIDPSGWKLPLFEDKPEPTKILDSFWGVVRRLYPESALRRQRRSIGLTLSHVHVDVLPAVTADESTIWIPDRDAGVWLQSSPKTHAAHATAMNKACGNRGKAMVKLLKHWNTLLPSTAGLKSFVVETLAVRILGEEKPTSLVDGLLCFWDNIVRISGGDSEYEWASKPRGVDVSLLGRLRLPDVTGKNIAADVSVKSFVRFAEKARIARDHLAGALNARSSGSAMDRLARLL
jgi:hypothetical protein